MQIYKSDLYIDIYRDLRYIDIYVPDFNKQFVRNFVKKKKCLTFI